MMDFGKKYTPIDPEFANGEPLKLNFKENSLRIRPLTGADMEAIEDMQSDLIGIEEGSKEYRQAKNEIIRKKLRLHLTGNGRLDTPEKMGKWFDSLSMSDFAKLKALVNEVLETNLKHGLEIYSTDDDTAPMLVYPMPCPENKEEKTPVGFRFRVIDFIPVL